MLIRLVLHSHENGWRSIVKRCDKRRYERLQNKIGTIEDGVELIRIELLEE